MKPMKYNTPKQRLKIYEKILTFVKNSHDDVFICNEIDNLADDRMHSRETLLSHFIEFNKYHSCVDTYEGLKKYKRLYGNEKTHYTKRNQWRIKVLTEIIESIKSNQ